MKKILLTVILLTGISVSLNAGEIEDYKKSCDSGDFHACFLLGNRYYSGIDVRQNYSRAFKLYVKSCDGGDASACINLSYAYKEGNGVKQNKSKSLELRAKAKKLNTIACDSGDANGCYSLGTTYSLKKDYLKAKKFYYKACDGSHAGGCSKLAFMYTFGSKGVKKNWSKGLELTIKSCNIGGDIGAIECNVLGGLYEGGFNVKQSYSKAKEFYGKACDGGHNDGCKKYADLNKRGY